MEKHTPTTNEIISDISEIAIRWPKETREMVFRAVNAHEELVSLLNELYEVFADSRFTDRQGYAKAIREALAKAEGKQA